MAGGMSTPVTARTVWLVGGNLLALAGLLMLVWSARRVLSWVLVALFVALALDPVVRFLERRRFPRGLAIAAVTLSALSVVALCLGTLVPMIVEQGRALVAATPELLDRWRENRTFTWLDDSFDVVGRAKREMGQRLGSAAGPLFQIVGSILHKAAATVAIAVLAVFMLVFGGALFRSLLAWVPPQTRPRFVSLATRMHRSVGGYVVGTLLIASIGGVVTAVTLLLLGVPYFLPLGLVMMLLGILPFVGAILGGVLIVLMTFLTAGAQAGGIALVVYLIYQQAENHLLQPLVQRHTIDMNPLVIALVMLVGTSLAGILGALLALPVAGALQVLLGDLLARRRALWGEAPAPQPSPPPSEVGLVVRDQPA